MVYCHTEPHSRRKPGSTVQLTHLWTSGSRLSPGLRKLQGAGDFLDLEALDHVADLDVLIILEGHAAFVAFAHLADLVLEAFQRLQGALVNDDVVAQQPH